MTPKLNEFLVFKKRNALGQFEDSPLSAISIWFFSTIVRAIPLKLANIFRAKWGRQTLMHHPTIPNDRRFYLVSGFSTRFVTFFASHFVCESLLLHSPEFLLQNQTRVKCMMTLCVT